MKQYLPWPPWVTRQETETILSMYCHPRWPRQVNSDCHCCGRYHVTFANVNTAYRTIDICDPITEVYITIDICDPTREVYRTMDICDPTTDVNTTINICDPTTDVYISIDVCDPTQPVTVAELVVLSLATLCDKAQI